MRNDNDASAITDTAYGIRNQLSVINIQSVRRDGKITTADVGMANSHAKGVITLTDYGFACADVKTDGSISTADVGMINSHAKSVSTLW